MRRLAIVLALMGTTGVAWAGGAKPTTIGISDSGTRGVGNGTYAFAYGTLSSPKEACEEGRKVKLYALKLGSKELFDTDTTGDDGAYAGFGKIDPAGYNRNLIKVSKATAGKTKCEAAQEDDI